MALSRPAEPWWPDLDILTVIPREVGERVSQIAGQGSALQKKYRVAIDPVSAVHYPADYQIRLGPFGEGVPHLAGITCASRANQAPAALTSTASMRPLPQTVWRPTPVQRAARSQGRNGP